jgi:HlyD family secretion protein
MNQFTGAESVQLRQGTMQNTSGQDRILTPVSRKGFRVLAIVFGTVALGALAWIASPAFSSLLSTDIAVSRQQLRFATVAHGDVRQDVAVQGRIVTANSPALFAPAAGTVNLDVKPGDLISEGQVIATIISPELNNQLAQERTILQRLSIDYERQQIDTRTIILTSQQIIETAAVDLELARSNEYRAAESMKVQVISKADFELNVAELRKAELLHRHAIQNLALQEENLEFELRAKKLEVDGQQLVVNNVERQVAELELKSPITGVVGSVNVRDRDVVARDTSIVMLVDLTAFEIEINIPESYADDLRLGLSAEIMVNNKAHEGQLTAISPEVTNGQVTGRIRFTGDTPSGLRQSQRLSANVLIESRQDVLKVKRGAFVQSGGGNTIYKVDGDTGARTAIELGARGLSDVEILSGLDDGDEVIISSINAFNGAEFVFISK